MAFSKTESVFKTLRWDRVKKSIEPTQVVNLYPEPSFFGDLQYVNPCFIGILCADKNIKVDLLAILDITTVLASSTSDE